MSAAVNGNIVWVSARVENAVGMAYTLANHAYLQVLSIYLCAGALSGALTSRDDERTPHAKL